jgi:glycosyltransferase involved in cell wall biosynthesis
LRWTDTTRRIVEGCRLWDADLVLLLPARITRRKNVQLAVRALACLRASTGLDARLIVTGPPGAHNPSNAAYLSQLLALRAELGLSQAVHLLYELGDREEPLVPDDATLADLFLLADALLFPSSEEGFGIPLLEAGLARLPAFCSDIPPLRATGQGDAHYFPPDAAPEAVADLVAGQLLTDSAFSLRRRVLRCHRWERILRDHLIPLIEGGQG